MGAEPEARRKALAAAVSRSFRSPEGTGTGGNGEDAGLSGTLRGKAGKGGEL